MCEHYNEATPIKHSLLSMNRYQQHIDEMKMITTYNIYIASVSVSFASLSHSIVESKNGNSNMEISKQT